MSRTLRLGRGGVAALVIALLIIATVAYFSIHPRLHPRLAADDVARVRIFAFGDRHYEWLLFDSAEIAKLVDRFNAGTQPQIDRSPLGDAPEAGLLFILRNGNGITVTAPPPGAGPGQVEVARGQYQYRLTAPALADYISALGKPESIPTDISSAAERIDAFLSARGRGDVAAESSLCTPNGRQNILKGLKERPQSPLYVSYSLLSISQEEYSPWQISQDGLADTLVVSAEWEAELTAYGKQYLAGQSEAEGHGRAMFLLVRTGKGEPWLIEDWQ